MADVSVKIPALVVSGFLGAGKTTLVRNLLRHAQEMGQRLAIVSNEFGELGIDQALLGQDGGGEYIELEGGCVCCQLSNELLSTLQNLWERVHPDRVVVETSGVALPFETLMTFWREPVCQWVDESLAVVVVNAEQVAEKRDLEGTFEQQVSSADLLVLNKVDLVPATQIVDLEAVLQDMASGTPIVRSVNAEVDDTMLFPPSPWDVEQSRRRVLESSHAHVHEKFDAQVLTIEKGVQKESLVQQCKAFKALRVKGIVHTDSGIRVVQGVGPRIDLVDPPTNIPSHLIGRVVVIRRG